MDIARLMREPAVAAARANGFGGRVLVVNRLPIASRGRPIGTEPPSAE